VDDITKLDIPSSKVWVHFGRKVLTEIDKDIIIFGKKLSDQHINFAQSLIKKILSSFSGLYSTLTVCQMSTPISSGKILQILHTGGDHWVLASNIDCGVGQVNLV